MKKELVMKCIAYVVFFWIAHEMEKECQEKLQRDGMRILALMRTLEPEITGKHRIQAVEKFKELQSESTA